MCEHGKHKRYCIPCGGSQICEHGKHKRYCIPCGGSQICEHGKQKEKCKECEPAKYKQTLENKRIRYWKKRGVKPGDIRVKIHEEAMISQLNQWYPKSELLLGKSVGNTCTENGTHRYPDVQLWIRPFLIVFECDENAHRGASYDCDHKRMNEIAISIGAPVWFVRWNPNGDKPIETIKGICDEILEADPSTIGWEYGQFNATYIGYKERDIERNENRRRISKK